MKARTATLIFGLMLVGSLARSQSKVETDRPTESQHRAGLHELDSWTLNWPLPDDENHGERYPNTLVIARNRNVVRKIEGDPFVWDWVFWDDGKQVAYSHGSLHFNLWCSLVDIKTGREIATVDCYADPLPKNAPAWVRALNR